MAVTFIPSQNAYNFPVTPENINNLVFQSAIFSTLAEKIVNGDVRIIGGAKSEFVPFNVQVRRNRITTQAGCGLPIQASTIDYVRQIGNPRHSVHEKLCWTDFETSLYQAGVGVGNDAPESVIDIFSNFFQNQVVDAISTDLVLQLFFGDTTLTDDNYNRFNGFYKNIKDMVAASEPIASGTHTFDLTDGDTIIAGFAKLVRDQKFDLKRIPNNQKRIYVSDKLATAYAQYLMSKDNTASYMAIIEGVPVLTYDNIPVIGIPEIEIGNEELGGSSGDLYDNPVFLTHPTNMVFTSDTNAPELNVTTNYIPLTKEVVYSADFRFGGNLVNPVMISALNIAE